MHEENEINCLIASLEERGKAVEGDVTSTDSTPLLFAQKITALDAQIKQYKIELKVDNFNATESGQALKRLTIKSLTSAQKMRDALAEYIALVD